MEFGLGILPDKPISELVHLYTTAEQMGVKFAWTCDEAPSYPFRDPYAVLAATGYATSHMKLGTAIHVPYTRHPALLAYAAKSYDELFPGRMILGIGPGGVLSLKPLGLKIWDRPLKAIREAVTICRKLLNGEEVTFEGDLFQLYNTKLYSPPESKLPIFLAARGPKMLQLAGEIADGSICTSPLSTIDWVVKQIKKGQEKTTYPKREFVLANTMGISIDNDEQKAREAIKKQIILNVVYASPKTHELTGVSLEDVEKLKDAVGGGWSASTDLVTEEMIDLYGITGSPDYVIEQMKICEKKGVSVFNLGSPFGPDREKAFESIKNKIIPAFQ